MLTHSECGMEFTPKVACSACGGEIEAHDVAFERIGLGEKRQWGGVPFSGHEGRTMSFFVYILASRRNGTLYVGSLTTGSIVRIRAGTVIAEEFVAAGTVAERGVVGLGQDPDERGLAATERRHPPSIRSAAPRS